MRRGEIARVINKAFFRSRDRNESIVGTIDFFTPFRDYE